MSRTAALIILAQAVFGRGKPQQTSISHPLEHQPTNTDRGIGTAGNLNLNLRPRLFATEKTHVLGIACLTRSATAHENLSATIRLQD